MKACISLPTLLGCVMVAGALQAGEAVTIAKVIAPVPGQAVETHARVKLQVPGPGHPIVAVRSTEKNGEWWIQAVAESISPHEFVVPSRFGNDNTPDGMRFEIVALMAPDAESAAAWKLGTTIKELPPKVPHSEIIEVVLDRAESLSQDATVKAELLSPPANGRAQRLQPVSIVIKDAPEDLPILLVRSAQAQSTWWVQDPLQRGEDGKFTGLARIGNDKTPPGSGFLLMLVVPNDQAARDALTPGVELKDVSHFERSRVFAVTSEGDRPQPIDVVASDS